jgi:ElaB/YqjD/DUF883 family membrane-anchored ribosome-binding protein
VKDLNHHGKARAGHRRVNGARAHSAPTAASQVLAQDVSALIADAEALLKAGSDVGEDSLRALREKLGESVEGAKSSLDDAEGLVRRRAESVDAYVHENAWQAMGLAAFLAFIFGFLFSKRTTSATS